ncbi:hypothetical protein [Neisseria montereyensis]|uniref:PspA/IM30 family protein n=1 Tax=Neisseria montereyensis TaxID=2973938 RepID=A0ABT2FE60_9NEIS|nr:hypothetical protein [Neisseria montereyensis]MCS4534504.1 hypothetical protein [Neisseria montereyensis]
MGFLSGLVDTIGNAMGSVIDTVCDLVSEPMRIREHNRYEEAKDSDYRRQVDYLQAQADFEADQVNLSIKKEAEIKRINAEIEEWRKDKLLERLKLTTEAIMHYQEELTKLNTQSIHAIGMMQIDLKSKAQDMVYQKVQRYRKLQDDALNQTMLEFEKIEKQFSNNMTAQEILYKAADRKLGNIIDTASAFLNELNSDIINLNQSIYNLTNKSQVFIENHLKSIYLEQIDLDCNNIDHESLNKVDVLQLQNLDNKNKS